jgi:outer membrane protein OmpA-like peptidoglycan-associated protein
MGMKRVGSMMHDGIENTGLMAKVVKRGWLPRAGAAFLVLGLTACSSLPDVPDYANPVEWYNSSTDLVGDWFKDDEPRIETASKKSDEKFPNLGTVPKKPAAKSTADARAKVKNQLLADWANARYTDEKPVAVVKTAGANAASKLKGSAPKPPALRAAAATSGASEQLARLPSTDYQGKRSSLWPNAPAPTSSSDAPATSARVGRPTVSAGASNTRPRLVASAPVMPETKAADTMSAASQAPAQASVQVPAVAPVAPPAPEIPPRFTLNPSDETQSETMTADTATQVLQLTPPSGAFETAPGQQPMLTFGSNAVDGASEIITFGHGSARLSNADRGKLRSLANQAVQARVYIRVVGHASMRTRNMDPFEHSLANFDVSLKRANVVALALIDMGVPPEQLIVDAVGDTQPLYSEAMPSGEQGNRRTEIYLES